MLNDETLRTINNAPKGEQLSVSITSEKLYALGLNTVNNLVITATDGQGGTTYRRLTFKRTNSAPAISGQDEDLGQQTGSFAEKYTVTTSRATTWSSPSSSTTSRSAAIKLRSARRRRSSSPVRIGSVLANGDRPAPRRGR